MSNFKKTFKKDIKKKVGELDDDVKKFIRSAKFKYCLAGFIVGIILVGLIAKCAG